MKKRFAALLLITVLMFALCAPFVSATEDSTAAASSVQISKFYVLGSNGKYYNPYPSVSSGGNTFSFTVPDWMEECTIYVISDSVKSVTCEGGEVQADGSTHTVKVKLENKSTKISPVLKGSSADRTLAITIYKEKIDCYIDTLNLLNSSSEAIKATSGSVANGLVYTFDAGTQSVPLRLVARHENEVWVENFTVDSSGALVGGAEPKTQLTLQYNRYDTTLKLIDGTNTFRVTVSAGTVTVTSDIQIIVGDAAANATVSTTTTTTAPTESTTAPTVAPTAAPTTTSGNVSGNLLSVFSNMSTGMGVLIGIIITVIVGAFIFMIVNMSSGSDRRNDYSEPEPLYRPRRRNLSEYADDDYYEDYGMRGIGRGRQDDYYGYDDRPLSRRDRDYDYDYDYYGQDSRSPRGYDRYGRDNQPRYGYDDDDNYGGY